MNKKDNKHYILNIYEMLRKHIYNSVRRHQLIKRTDIFGLFYFVGRKMGEIWRKQKIKYLLFLIIPFAF